MFRVAYRLSSGALTVFAASGLDTHVVTGRSQVRVGTATVKVFISVVYEEIMQCSQSTVKKCSNITNK
jgi:hypothetical protein